MKCKTPAGKLLFVSEPYVHVLSRNQRGLRCDWCFELNESDVHLLRCQQCKFTYYCKKSCQRFAWSLHKVECICLKNISPHIPSESVRMLLKLIIRHQAEDSINNQEALPHDRMRRFVDLESHTGSILSDGNRSQDFLKICQALKQFIGNYFKYTYRMSNNSQC